MKKRTIFIACAAVYLAAVIVAAVILGVVGAANLAMACNTARVSEGMYAYFQAQQRYRYIGEHGIYDTALFWRQPAEDGTDDTHDEAAEKLTREYIEYIAAAAYLFDSLGYTLSDSDRDYVDKYCDEKVHYIAGGDRNAFNEAAAKYGFDYTDMRNVELMAKKMQDLRESMVADEMQQDAYYKEKYVRIKLAYVVKSDAAYADKCSMLRLAQSAPTTPAQLAAGEDEFSTAVADIYYNADIGMREHQSGYYFSKSSQFTDDTYSTMPQLVDAVFALAEVGATGELTVDVRLDDTTTETRTYFLRRYDLETLAYTQAEYQKYNNEMFFSDFVARATDQYFFKYCDSARVDCAWSERQLWRWVPVGSNSDLFKFF